MISPRLLNLTDPLLYSLTNAGYFNRDCKLWHKTLRKIGLRSTEVNSFLSQKKRTQNLNKFLSGSVNLLLTTDLGSRGLDIRTVELVINYDLPKVYKDYIHRAGRAARGGQRGKCISIITENNIERLKESEEKLGNQATLYKDYKESDLMEFATLIDKALRRANINLMIKGKDKEHDKIKDSKRLFRESITLNK